MWPRFSIGIAAGLKYTLTTLRYIYIALIFSACLLIATPGCRFIDPDEEAEEIDTLSMIGILLDGLWIDGKNYGG